ncbi:MAG: hypothetical protein K9W44_04010 [Candidatus Lokiarchaeota archaeon]|nr:hypothetical protein [Candidatus Harpocratesius repetitus]
MVSQIKTNIISHFTNPAEIPKQKFEYPSVKDIDEIVEKHDPQGNYIGLKSKKRIVQTNFYRFSTYEEAEAIAKIFNTVN